MSFEEQRPPPPGPSALSLPVIRPIPARTLVAGMSVVILLAAVFSYFVEVPRREYMSGRLEPFGGEIKLRALRAGTVAALAPPGSEVDRGELAASVVERLPAVATPASGPQLAQVPLRDDMTVSVNTTVLSNAVSNGSTVMAGQLLSVLSVRYAPMQAMLFVPSRALAHMQPGKILQLRLTAFPYETFGQVQAVVERVELSTLPETDLAVTAAGDGGQDTYYKATARVLLAPQQTTDGIAVVLRSGMPLEASVEVERRTLLAWVVWPLLKQFN